MLNFAAGQVVRRQERNGSREAQGHNGGYEMTDNVSEEHLIKPGTT